MWWKPEVSISRHTWAISKPGCDRHQDRHKDRITIALARKNRPLKTSVEKFSCNFYHPDRLTNNSSGCVVSWNYSDVSRRDFGKKSSDDEPRLKGDIIQRLTNYSDIWRTD